mmetsp:Transcript_18574/g.18658  ORF Transcript_18574/g.18658 Transcript_18574/m.18658 type:complete len:103 (-) Transcript_18574:75-383(-)
MLVKIMSGSDCSMEWCLVEFQGEISGQALEGCDLGTLSIAKDGIMTEMEIGQHVLKGRVEKLSKAFVIIEKSSDLLEILGSVRKKIIFNTRPRPRSSLSRNK